MAVPRMGLTPDGVVEVALGILDANGTDALTLAAVAERAGVAAPSLYKHVAGLAELRTLVARRVLEEMAAELGGSVLGRSRDDAIDALMRAARRYVLDHPARYGIVPVDPLREPALVAAGTRLIDVFLAVLRGYGLDGAAAIHATRCLRSIVHGFCAIEAAGGFGLSEDLDVTYQQLIRMFTASMPDAERSSR